VRLFVVDRGSGREGWDINLICTTQGDEETAPEKIGGSCRRFSGFGGLSKASHRLSKTWLGVGRSISSYIHCVIGVIRLSGFRSYCFLPTSLHFCEC
jgi:hypothetical protein